MIKTICGTCGEEFLTYAAWIRKGAGKHCSKECHRIAQVGGSYIKRADGYVSVKHPSHHRANQWGFVYEHVLASEKKIGRLLLDSEVVHHLDGNPSNNISDNLYVCDSVAEHRRQHANKRIVDRGGNPETDKICHKCKRILLKTHFSPSSSRGKPALSSACKECCAEYQRSRRAA